MRDICVYFEMGEGLSREGEAEMCKRERPGGQKAKRLGSGAQLSASPKRKPIHLFLGGRSQENWMKRQKHLKVEGREDMEGVHSSCLLGSSPHSQ